MLLHLHGDIATHGYWHGSITAWSSDGVLLATGSQTASMTHVFDGPDDPQMEEWRQSIVRAAQTAAADQTAVDARTAADAAPAPAEGGTRG